MHGVIFIYKVFKYSFHTLNVMNNKPSQYFPHIWEKDILIFGEYLSVLIASAKPWKQTNLYIGAESIAMGAVMVGCFEGSQDNVTS